MVWGGIFRQSISRYFYGRLLVEHFEKSRNGRVMLTDNTRKYLLWFKDYMTKSNTCLFATVLCLIPENVYGRT